MAMTGLQWRATKILHKFLAPVSSRAAHSLAELPQHHSSMDISVPRISLESENEFGAARSDHSGDLSSFYRYPFMDLMAVPKRKVTPSRKGKRNGPKAYKPVTTLAKCKICGRVKLPHLYCCSGEIKS